MHRIVFDAADCVLPRMEGAAKEWGGCVQDGRDLQANLRVAIRDVTRKWVLARSLPGGPWLLQRRQRDVETVEGIKAAIELQGKENGSASPLCRQAVSTPVTGRSNDI